MKTFKLPSPTGRMSHNKPEIQFLPGSPSPWKEAQDEIVGVFAKAKAGKSYIMSEQGQLAPGDLVVWGPSGKVGLWVITDIHHPYKGVGADVDFRSIEKSLADLSPEAQDVFEKKYKLPRKRHSVRQGYVRLEWFAGWNGYSGDGLPVSVKIKSVRRPNEMEALGIAASDA